MAVGIYYFTVTGKQNDKHFKVLKNMAYMSQEGYEKLVADLQRLESIERPKASAAIAEARDKGDLSENSEYEAAKEAQAHLEDRINRMKLAINEAKMTNLATQAKMCYTIVSENEANLKEGKIAITTPIAQGLLNKKEGDEVEITIPRGTIKLRIDKITVG